MTLLLCCSRSEASLGSVKNKPSLDKTHIPHDEPNNKNSTDGQTWNPVVAPVLPVALAALRPPNPPPRPPPVDIDVKAVPKPVVPDMFVSQARGRRRELEQNVIGVNGTVDRPHPKQFTVLPPFGQTEHIF